MAQTKKRNTTTKKGKTSRKKKKAKVYIPANSIITMCAIVAVLCTMLLIVNTISSGKDSKKSQNPEQKQKIEKTSTIDKKTEQKSQEKKQTVQIQKKQSAKEEPEKVNKITRNPEKELKQSSNKQKKEEKKSTQLKPPAVNENKNSKPKTEEKSVEKNIGQEKVKPSVKEEKPAPETVEKKSEPVEKKPSKNSDIPAIPVASKGARLVIIFDDGGQNLNQLEKCVTLPFPVTVAVLPRLSHSREAAARVRSSGNEVILHQPMQSVSDKVNPGPGAIKPGMDEDQIRTLLFQNIREIAPITGVNNHEGSLITANAEQMSFVMKACSDEGVYFLDSRTNVETKVPYVAAALGYSYYERNVFLDNKKTRENIITEIMKGLSIANKKGVAIMIGHVWSAEILPGILQEMYPLLKEKGYTFTTVSNSGARIIP